jgi:hypothetical protein
MGICNQPTEGDDRRRTNSNKNQSKPQTTMSR